MDITNARREFYRRLAATGALVTDRHMDPEHQGADMMAAYTAAHHAGELPAFVDLACSEPDFAANDLLRHLAGNALITLGRTQEAVEHLDAAIRMRAGDSRPLAVSLCSRAVALEALGDRSGALDDLDRAEERFPTYVGIHVNRLVVACHARSESDVARALERLEAAHPQWRRDDELLRLLNTDIELRFARQTAAWTQEVPECVA